MRSNFLLPIRPGKNIAIKPTRNLSETPKWTQMLCQFFSQSVIFVSITVENLDSRCLFHCYRFPIFASLQEFISSSITDVFKGLERNSICFIVDKLFSM